MRELHICWEPFQESESSIAEYEYRIDDRAVGARHTDGVFQSVGLNTSVTVYDFDVEAGQRYFLTVRATNTAGLSSVGVLLDVVVREIFPKSFLEMHAWKIVAIVGAVFFVVLFHMRHAVNAVSRVGSRQVPH